MSTEDGEAYHARRYLEEIALARTAACGSSEMAHIHLAALHRQALAQSATAVADPVPYRRAAPLAT